VARAVLDPGVLVSARIAPQGAPGALLVAWLAGEFELIVCPALLDELGRVLIRPKFRRYLSEKQAEVFVAQLAKHAEMAADPEVAAGLTRDPDDDYLVALARTAGADVLVSGDTDLTSLKDPEPPILTPRAFLTMLEAE
jgi:putative PIN family toxin of toxin-antitoxin system